LRRYLRECLSWVKTADFANKFNAPDLPLASEGLLQLRKMAGLGQVTCGRRRAVTRVTLMMLD
jgi:hypothetical protein